MVVPLVCGMEIRQKRRYGEAMSDSALKLAQFLIFVSVLFGSIWVGQATNYELKVVDAAKNSGGTWTFHDWVIPGKMTVAPPYTRRTMDEFFGGLDVLLFPSQWKESFGLTVREAFARDVWVIATDAGGVVEDCVHGTNATVIPMDGSSHGLETAIRECLARTCFG